jgi:hypothetical protein
MKARNPFLVLVVFLTNCAKPPSYHPVPVENDKSIVFPQFFDQPPVNVGAGGGLYQLDGVVLRAIMIAASDFLPPPDDKEQPCWRRWEAQQYRVVRQGEIVFVRIDDNLEFCGLNYISLDSGVEYAISTSGRILRRIFDADPIDSPSPAAPDAGTHAIPTNPPPFSVGGPPQDAPPPPLPAERGDGGTTGPAGPVPPPAPPSAPDGGPARAP